MFFEKVCSIRGEVFHAETNLSDLRPSDQVWSLLSFCKQWIRNPNYVNATYYLNERHPAHETDCEYHNAGSASWETSARAGTDAIRTLADRAKVYSQTQKAAGVGRQASVRTQNQNSMSYQTTQRRSAVQQGKNQKKKGKMSLVLVILSDLFALSGINYLYRMFMYLFGSYRFTYGKI